MTPLADETTESAFNPEHPITIKPNLQTSPSTLADSVEENECDALFRPPFH